MANAATGEVEYDENGNIINKINESETRFFKLTQIDQKFENYTFPEFNNTISLEELCERFRNYAASKLHLYYDIDLIRLFIKKKTGS